MSNDAPRTMMSYRGENIDELPRERLVEIIHELASALDTTRAAALSSTRMFADLVRRR